jgi:hypothetical protein
MKPTTAIAASIPISLVVMATVAGTTAQVTGADRAAIKRAMIYFGGAMVVAAVVSGNAGAGIATTISVGVAFYGLNHAWQ